MGAAAVRRPLQLRGLVTLAAPMKLARAFLILVLALFPLGSLAEARSSWAAPRTGLRGAGHGCRAAHGPRRSARRPVPEGRRRGHRGARQHADPRHGAEGRRSSRARARGVPGGPRDQAPADGRAPGARRGAARTDTRHVGPGGVLAGHDDRGGRQAGGSLPGLVRARCNLVLLPLLGGVRESLVEAAIQELVERLGATGRFRVSMGDPINVYLAQEGIKAEDFLQGKGVQQAAQRFKVENLLAIYFKRVQSKPYMEVRFYDASPAGSRDQHGVLRAAVHPIGGGRAGRPVLGGGRAGESTPGQAAVAPGPAARGRSRGRQLLERGGDHSAAPGGPIRLPGSGHGRGDRAGRSDPSHGGERRRSDLHVQDHRAAHGAGVDEVGALSRPHHLRAARRPRR